MWACLRYCAHNCKNVPQESAVRRAISLPSKFSSTFVNFATLNFRGVFVFVLTAQPRYLDAQIISLIQRLWSTRNFAPRIFQEVAILWHCGTKVCLYPSRHWGTTFAYCIGSKHHHDYPEHSTWLPLILKQDKLLGVHSDYCIPQHSTNTPSYRIKMPDTYECEYFWRTRTTANFFQCSIP